LEAPVGGVGEGGKGPPQRVEFVIQV
jgi:hypothetical protein